MRKRLLIAIPLVALLALAGAWLLFARTADPIAAAKRRMAHNNMEGASLYLRDAVRTRPKNPEAAFLLGEVDLALGKPAAAQLELTRARGYGYNTAAIVVPLGQAYLQQRHYAELLRDFVPALGPPAARAETLSLRAAAQMSMQDVNAADASSAAAESLGPDIPYVLLTAARLALVRGDLEGTASRIEKLLSVATKLGEPMRDDALLLKGELAMRRNDSKAALAAAHAVIQATPTRFDAHLLEARALAASGDEKAARTEIDTVLRRAPKDVFANFLRAVIAIHSADYATADASLQVIGQAVTELPRGLYVLAVTKLGLQQFAQADAAITQFLAQNPDDLGGLKLSAFLELARNHPDRTLALLHDTALAAHQDADTLDLRGRALAMTGDAKGARDSFAKASALRPSDPNILNRLAAIEMDLGNFPAGEADLKHSLELAPAQRRTGAAIVEADLARFDLDAAHKDLDALRASLGDVGVVGLLEASIRLAGLDGAGAEAELRALRKRYPKDRSITLLLLRSLALRGETSEAQPLLEDAVRQQPEDADLLGRLLPSLVAQGQVAEAVALAQTAHDARPADPRLTAILADAYVHAGQADRAIGLLDRGSAGTNAPLDLMRAGILAQQGKSAPAAAILRTVLERDPVNTRARLLLSALQLKIGDAAAARASLREGLKQTPGNPPLLDELVGIDLKQAATPQAGLPAALATAAALRADPANLPAAYSLPGEIYLAAGDPRAATAATLAAYKAAPSGELAIKAAIAANRAGNAMQGAALLEAWTAAHPADLGPLLVLSSLDLEGGRLAPAARCLQAVLATDPTNAAALNNLAWIRQHQGNTAASKTLAEQAYFVSPGLETADTLGWILAQQGETATALPLLKQAVGSTDPSLHAAASYHYAVALAAAGQRDEARTAVQSALATTAGFHDHDDAARFLSNLK